MNKPIDLRQHRRAAMQTVFDNGSVWYDVYFGRTDPVFDVVDIVRVIEDEVSFAAR